MCFHMSIVNIELVPLNCEVRELIRAANMAANIKPRTPTKQNINTFQLLYLFF